MEHIPQAVDSSIKASHFFFFLFFFRLRVMRSSVARTQQIIITHEISWKIMHFYARIEKDEFESYHNKMHIYARIFTAVN